MYKIFKILILLSCLPIMGCTGSTYSSHFDCPLGTGVGCASLSKVNKMIDRQQIDLEDDDGFRCHRQKDEKERCGSLVEKPFDSQVYIYYGPDHLSKLISIPNSPQS